MTRREDLLERAARCFERSEQYADAGDCYWAAGLAASAGQAYLRAGDLGRAAECLRAGHQMQKAAELYEELGRPLDSADCWEAAGDRLRCGWVLATRTLRISTARRLFLESPVETASRRLRRTLGLGVCVARAETRTGPLESAVAECAAGLDAVQVESERRLVESWAVEAAMLVGRPDMAAHMFAASHRLGVRGAAGRWRSWSASALGDTFGVPMPEAATAAGPA